MFGDEAFNKHSDTLFATAMIVNHSGDWDGKNQKAFVLFDASQEDNSFPRLIHASNQP